MNNTAFCNGLNKNQKMTIYHVPIFYLKENSWIKKWLPVTLDEMKAFLSLIIAMGLTRKNDLQQYWTHSEVMDMP
jgi:hypothetical protein